MESTDETDGKSPPGTETIVGCVLVCIDSDVLAAGVAQQRRLRQQRMIAPRPNNRVLGRKQCLVANVLLPKAPL